MSTDLFDVIEWNKCFLVLYSQDENNQPILHYHKSLILLPSKKDDGHDFWSVPASKFGIQVPPAATHWAVCLMDDTSNEILFEDLIPGTYEFMTLDISDTKEILVQRYDKYMRFTAGTKLALRSNHQRRLNRFKQISSS